jgi:hypothetical protein
VKPASCQHQPATVARSGRRKPTIHKNCLTGHVCRRGARQENRYTAEVFHPPISPDHGALFERRYPRWVRKDRFGHRGVDEARHDCVATHSTARPSLGLRAGKSDDPSLRHPVAPLLPKARNDCWEPRFIMRP